jgi:hypothetical protein
MSAAEPETFEELASYLRSEYEGGNKAALPEMIWHCVLYDQPVPPWARDAYVEVYSSVMSGGASSWDAVFGKPHPKGKHIDSIWRKNRKYEVYWRVMEIHERDGDAIGDELFERVGRDLGIGGKTVVEELYSKVARTIRRASEPRQR